MTDQGIARALESMIREDAKRPPEEQVRDLLEAGVIDARGRVLIGFWNQPKPEPNAGPPNGPTDESAPPSAEIGN
jgi:hypothetical protein